MRKTRLFRPKYVPLVAGAGVLLFSTLTTAASMRTPTDEQAKAAGDASSPGLHSLPGKDVSLDLERKNPTARSVGDRRILNEASTGAFIGSSASGSVNRAARTEAITTSSQQTGKLEAMTLIGSSVHEAFFSSFARNVITMRLAEITVPVLLVNCGKVTVVSPAEQYRTVVGLPASRAVVLADERYMLPLEAPDPTARAMIAFFAEQARSQSGRVAGELR